MSQTAPGGIPLSDDASSVKMQLQNLLSREDPVHGLGVYDSGINYETVAASQTNQVLGTTGAAGDRIARVIVVATGTLGGVVTLKDGSGTAFNILHAAAAGTYVIELGMISTLGAWQLTTPTNCTAIAVGTFT